MKFLYILFSVAAHFVYCSLVLDVGQDAGNYNAGEGEVILVEVSRLAGQGEGDEYLLLKHALPSPFELKGVRIGNSRQFGIYSDKPVSEAQVYFKKRVPLLLKLVTTNNTNLLFENLGRNSWKLFVGTDKITEGTRPIAVLDKIYSDIETGLTLDICKRTGTYHADVAGKVSITVGPEKVVGNYKEFVHTLPQDRPVRLFSCGDVHQDGISYAGEREVSVFFREDIPIVIRFRGSNTDRFYRLFGQDVWEPVNPLQYLPGYNSERADAQEEVIKPGDKTVVDLGSRTVTKVVPFEPPAETDTPVIVQRVPATTNAIESGAPSLGAETKLQESALFKLLDDAFVGASRIIVIDIGKRTGNKGFDQYLTQTYFPSVTAHAIVLRKAETDEYAVYNHQLAKNTLFKVFGFIQGGQVVGVKYKGHVAGVRVYWSKVSNDPVFVDITTSENGKNVFFYNDGTWKSTSNKEESLKLALEAAKSRPVVRGTEEPESTLIEKTEVENTERGVLRGAENKEEKTVEKESTKKGEKKTSGFKTCSTGLLVVSLLYFYVSEF